MRSLFKLVITMEVVLAALTGPVLADTFIVAKTTPYAGKISTPAEKLSECQLDTRLPEYIESAAEPGLDVIISDETLDGGTGKVLVLEIVRVDERAGGIGFKRPARVAVRGELTEYGQLIGSFIGMRHTLKTAIFDGFKGTCASLGRSLEMLSRDIATWLANPAIDAKLGDL